MTLVVHLPSQNTLYAEHIPMKKDNLDPYSLEEEMMPVEYSARSLEEQHQRPNGQSSGMPHTGNDQQPLLAHRLVLIRNDWKSTNIILVRSTQFRQ